MAPSELVDTEAALTAVSLEKQLNKFDALGKHEAAQPGKNHMHIL